MINHARTLLLNRVDDKPSTAFFEYVEPEFRPLVLPGALAAVRATLLDPIGRHSVDRYRVRQLLSLIHATELERYVLALDTRITYLPFPRTFTAMPQELVPLHRLAAELEPVFEKYPAVIADTSTDFGTFVRLWQSRQTIPRIIGATLALIYRLEELRCEMEER